MNVDRYLPDWAKVSASAFVGLATPVAASVVETLGPILDLVIKGGQVGVAAVTILYIYSKWRKLRNKDE